MRKSLLAIVCTLFFSCSTKVSPPIAPLEVPVPPCAFSQVQMSYIPSDETVQKMIQDETLIGGVPADITLWPASVYMSNEDGAACSSTLIGDRVLLSASHCVKQGGVIEFTAGANKYSARCEQHPEYKGNTTADWALCLIDRPVTGITFERLATMQGIRVGDKVRLTGYGCTRAGGGGGNDGIFRIGIAEVTSTPNGKNYDVVTKGGAALCFGDSGGAAYVEFKDGSREVFGVNSRGNIKNISYLPSVANGTMQSFAKDFASKHGVQICGITPRATACRDEKEPVTPSYDFEIPSQLGCLRGKVNPGQESKKESWIQRLKDASK
jgi:hypothetical protein